MILFAFIWIGFLLYTYFLVWSAISYRKRCLSAAQNNENPVTSFSLVIPFRNESAHLPALMASIYQLNYPLELLEILFVNDHSEDQGEAQVFQAISGLPFQARLLHNPAEKTGKKAALTLGITESRNPYIVATDADGILPENLLLQYDLIISRADAKFIAGPVVYIGNSQNFHHQYQIIENAGLVVLAAFGITHKKPFMANGANLCFERSAFFALEGYQGNLHIPGGDDEFLLEKMFGHYPAAIHFLYAKAALVQTPVQSTLASLLSQRVRWASKGKNRSGSGILLLQFLVFLLFLSVPFSIILSLTMPIFWYFVCIPGLKIMADLWFYYLIKPCFGLTQRPLVLIGVSLAQTLFVPIIALFAMRGKFLWKGRSFKT